MFTNTRLYVKVFYECDKFDRSEKKYMTEKNALKKYFKKLTASLPLYVGECVYML